MKVIIGGLALLLLLVASDPAAAQRPGEKPEGVAGDVEDAIRGSGLLGALDSIAAASGPELARSMEQLAGSLEIVVTRIASDPQLRVSAIRAAQSLTEIAHAVVVDQSRALQDALREAAERLATMSVQPDTIPPRPR